MKTDELLIYILMKCLNAFLKWKCVDEFDLEKCCCALY